MRKQEFGVWFSLLFWVAVLVAICSILPSCRSAPIYRETRIVDTVLVVKPEPIEASMAAVREADTLVRADQIRGGDTIIKVRYYPKTNTITVYAQPDTVKVPYRDTTTIFKEAVPVEKTPWWAWIMAAAAVVMFVVWIKTADNEE